MNDAQLRARLKDEILAAYLADTAKTRILEPNGDYRRARPATGKTAFSAQDFFMQLAEGRVTADQIPPPVEMRPERSSRQSRAFEIARAQEERAGPFPASPTGDGPAASRS